MIWTCFSYYEVGLIHWIKTIMDQPKCRLFGSSSRTPMTPSTREKKKWFADNIINIMEWPPQSPVLTSIENLWTDVKKAVHTCNPTSNISLDGCKRNLGASYY